MIARSVNRPIKDEWKVRGREIYAVNKSSESYTESPVKLTIAISACGFERRRSVFVVLFAETIFMCFVTSVILRCSTRS